MSTVATGTIDADTFRHVMGSFPAGVAVVTTLTADRQPAGLTTTAVTSVSLEPPLLLVCIDRRSRTLPSLRASGRFAVNFLGSAHAELALHFASKHERKFDDIVWAPGPAGLPILSEHCSAWAATRLRQEVEAGDHLVLIGEVTDAEAGDTKHGTLIYASRRFGRWTAVEG